jgi:hypothetical protein
MPDPTPIRRLVENEQDPVVKAKHVEGRAVADTIALKHRIVKDESLIANEFKTDPITNKPTASNQDKAKSHMAAKRLDAEQDSLTMARQGKIPAKP